MTFEGTSAGGSAISFEHAHACEAARSRIRSLAGDGIRIAKGCYQTRIFENHITHTIGSGIVVAGVAHPETWTDIVQEKRTTHNTLSFCGSLPTSNHNTLFSTISHNVITRNLGRVAISAGGWSNLDEAITGGYRIERNHVHHVQEQRTTRVQSLCRV